jgi:hypothetical protein
VNIPRLALNQLGKAFGKLTVVDGLDPGINATKTFLVLSSAPTECELLVVGTFSTQGSVLASSTPMLSERKSRCPDGAEAPSGAAVEGYFGA